MKKHTLAVAVCWLLSSVAAQAAAAIVGPADRSTAPAAQTPVRGDVDREVTPARPAARRSTRADASSAPQKITHEYSPSQRTKPASSVPTEKLRDRPRQVVGSMDRSKAIIQNATPPKPSVAGQKQDENTGTLIAYQPRSDGPRRLVHAYPDGTKLFASLRDGEIRGYSAVDKDGRALKVAVTRNPQEGTVPGPEDPIARGKRRAEEARNRQAEDSTPIGKWDKCWVKMASPDGTLHWWNTGCIGKFLVVD